MRIGAGWFVYGVTAIGFWMIAVVVLFAFEGATVVGW
jgi:hypothetical protein